MLAVLPRWDEVAAIPGLSFRHTTGEQDTDALHAVHTGCMHQDRLDPFSTARELPRREDLQTMLAQVVARGHADRVLLAEIGGSVVGYTRVSSWREADGACVLLVLGWVLPAWRGNGIGTTMLHWGEERARLVAASEYQGERYEFAANASSTEAEATALLLHEGYRVGYTVLEMAWEPRALPPALLPPGVDTRPVLLEHCEQIAASVDEAYRSEYQDGRFMEVSDLAEYATYLAGPQQDRSLWQVAWDGDEIAGEVMSQITDNRAEVFEVSVRPAWRRRGLARALLTRSLECLVERRVDAIGLGTVAEFPTRACDLYRSLGFRVVKEFPRYRKPA